MKKNSWSVRFAVAAAAALNVSSAAADEIPVYDATQVAYGHYDIVKRIWAGGWRSALWVPQERELAGAQRAVVREAARAGADAVVNLTCMNRTDSLFYRAGYYCYGDAIKAKPPAVAMDTPTDTAKP